MQSLEWHERVEVVFVDYCFNHVFVGLSACLYERYLYEMSRPLLPKQRPLFSNLLRQLNLLTPALRRARLNPLSNLILLRHLSQRLANLLRRIVLEIALQIIRI